MNLLWGDRNRRWYVTEQSSDFCAPHLTCSQSAINCRVTTISDNPGEAMLRPPTPGAVLTAVALPIEFKGTSDFKVIGATPEDISLAKNPGSHDMQDFCDLLMLHLLYGNKNVVTDRRACVLQLPGG